MGWEGRGGTFVQWYKFSLKMLYARWSVAWLSVARLIVAAVKCRAMKCHGTISIQYVYYFGAYLRQLEACLY